MTILCVQAIILTIDQYIGKHYKSLAKATFNTSKNITLHCQEKTQMLLLFTKEKVVHAETSCKGVYLDRTSISWQTTTLIWQKYSEFMPSYSI